MGQLDNLIVKINGVLTNHSLTNLSEAKDATSLFHDALKSVWSGKSNQTERDKIASEISDLFIPFLGAKNAGNLLEENKPNLDHEFPPDSDFVDSYNLCIDLYNSFLDSFIKRLAFDFDKIEVIIKKIIMMVKNYKADLIGHISINRPNIDPNVKHGVDTSILALISGDILKMNDKQLRELALVGLFHDIGMLKIPPEILNKEGKLTEEEYNKIKTHPIISYKLINDKNIFGKDVLSPIIQHHEQYDGNGYPRKLAGDKIHVYAKIMAIADTFEAQISDRAYRKSKTGYSAMKEVLAESQNRFDPKILRTFLSVLSIYPPGTIVQLNNNVIASVLEVNQNAPVRPLLKVLLDENGEKQKTPRHIDLKTTPSVYILKVLDKSQLPAE